ncbi:MAG: metalloregulator ArsR/SmtB family transcription factor [Terriglobales bacterium]
MLQTLQGGAMTVNQIVSELDGKQPNISKHLQILFDAGLVGRARSRNSVFYSVADPVVFKLCDLVCRSTARHAAHLQQYAAGTGRRSGIQTQKSHLRSKVGSLQGVN